MAGLEVRGVECHLPLELERQMPEGLEAQAVVDFGVHSGPRSGFGNERVAADGTHLGVGEHHATGLVPLPPGDIGRKSHERPPNAAEISRLSREIARIGTLESEDGKADIGLVR
jgi:hypothetical protein